MGFATFKYYPKKSHRKTIGSKIPVLEPTKIEEKEDRTLNPGHDPNFHARDNLGIPKRLYAIFQIRIFVGVCNYVLVVSPFHIEHLITDRSR